MFIPVRSDRPLRTTPYVNYGLIAANVLIFAATGNAIAEQADWVNRLMLNKWALNNPETGAIVTRLWQFITYQFLHADGWHLIGNMIFLWVFGNAVEDRLGKAGYLFFYLAMGVFAGLAHWVTSDSPVLGASGSVAGVTGAFLALFPRTRITFIYFFFLIGAFEVPAMLVVLFYFVKDLFFYGLGGGAVAYTAHLGGNLVGFIIGMALLWTRLLPREPYDLLSLFEHKRRRDKFKKIAEQGYTPWDRGRHTPKGKLTGGGEPELTDQERQVLAARQAISRAIAAHDMDAAAKQYLDLIANHGEQTLGQKQQFDLANHLFSQGQHRPAADAYTRLLEAYPHHPDRGYAQLMLGLIHARYLGRADAAKPYLQEASQRLQGDDAALARQLLSEIG